MRFKARIDATAVAAFAMVIVGCSVTACHGSSHLAALHGHSAPAGSSAPQPTTYKMNDDGADWKRSPQMRAFYDYTAATFANGTDIDVDAYEAKSFAMFREFARANGVSEAAMVDHLKLIPRQVVGIVKENRAVLNSYDDFWVAMVGPD
jgi:hypothetical protein